MRALLPVVAVGLIAGPISAQAPRRTTTSSAISADDLRQRLFLIAHDSMMGRLPGEVGNYKTAEYVAGEFKRLGLEPAGENGSYFQSVPFVLMAADAGSFLEVGGTRLTLGRDFVLVGPATTVRSISNTPAIYGGPVRDPSQWASGDSAVGKVVVLDVRPDPDGTRNARGLGITDPRFNRAALIAIVGLDLFGSEIRAAIMAGRLTVNSTLDATVVPRVFISDKAASALLGGDPSTMTPGTAGRTVNGRVGSAPRQVAYAARNVVAVLRGSDPRLRGTYVALTAHNDHVGFDHSPVDHDSLRAYNRVIRPMGADSPPRPPTPEEAARIAAIRDSLRKAHPARLDSIRNGADDDGSGTVSILEIAQALAGAPHPKRSILFVNHTGEEAGLVGSAWFTDHPTVPIDSIVAEIDQDMVGRGTADDLPEAGPTYLEVIGAKRVSKEFGEILEAANAAQPKPFVFNYTYDQPGHPLQYYCRADHYNYARYTIPAVAFSRGEHLDYHQVTDEPQYIDYDDMARVTRLVYDAALRIANLDHRPKVDIPKGDPHGPCRQ
ncbi:MAG TPA: M28 family peptidase [Gemmatimonadaceae bacterium]|nr:M28 family peptidase [Gemmatimonadaceae bacterium]